MYVVDFTLRRDKEEKIILVNEMCGKQRVMSTFLEKQCYELTTPNSLDILDLSKFNNCLLFCSDLNEKLLSDTGQNSVQSPKSRENNKQPNKLYAKGGSDSKETTWNPKCFVRVN